MREATAPQLDAEMFEQIVQLLVDAAHPSRIILFGSHARGDQTIDSDLDLLIVEDGDVDRARENVRLRRVLSPLLMPIDVLVYSETDLETRGQWSGTAVYDALREGKVLYAAK